MDDVTTGDGWAVANLEGHGDAEAQALDGGHVGRDGQVPQR
jgi:hypothetical protein